MIGCRLQEFQPRVKLNSTCSVGRAAPGLRLNEHIEADGPTVFAHACKMGLEGIVSKRKASTSVAFELILEIEVPPEPVSHDDPPCRDTLP